MMQRNIFCVSFLCAVWMVVGACGEGEEPTRPDMPNPAQEEPNHENHENNRENNDTPEEPQPEAPPVDPDPETQAQFESVLRQWSADQNAGLSASVYYRGSQWLTGSWGMANDTEEVTQDTIFEVGSVTKMFTAALTLEAVMRGELSWSDPVEMYLDDFAQGDDITVERLVLQTTGLYNYTNSRAFAEGIHDPWSPEALRTIIEEEPLAFLPGSAFSYSNSNYYLLGLVLEEAAGEPFPTLVAKRIGEPLGLARTGMCDIDPNTTPRAQGYSDGPLGRRSVPSVDMSAPFSAGGLCATAYDIATFANAYYGEQWFTTQELSTPPVFSSGLTSPYTYATFVGRTGWQNTISHGGNIPGFTAQVIRWPELDLTLVLLTNLNAAGLSELSEDILRVVSEVDRPVVEEPLRPEEIASLVGIYSAPDLPPLEVIENNGAIELLVQGNTLGLQYLGERDFETVPTLLRLRFLESQLEVEQNGILLTLTKE